MQYTTSTVNLVCLVLSCILFFYAERLTFDNDLVLGRTRKSNLQTNTGSIGPISTLETSSVQSASILT